MRRCRPRDERQVRALNTREAGAERRYARAVSLRLQDREWIAAGRSRAFCANRSSWGSAAAASSILCERALSSPMICC